MKANINVVNSFCIQTYTVFYNIVVQHVFNYQKLYWYLCTFSRSHTCSININNSNLICIILNKKYFVYYHRLLMKANVNCVIRQQIIVYLFLKMNNISYFYPAIAFLSKLYISNFQVFSNILIYLIENKPRYFSFFVLLF